LTTPERKLRLVVAAVVYRGDRYLLARRPPGRYLEGLWEFPGGGVHEGEDPPVALARELLEELGVGSQVGEPLTFALHEGQNNRILLLFYRAAISGEPVGVEGQEIGWFTSQELAGLPLPPADAALVAVLTGTSGGLPGEGPRRQG